MNKIYILLSLALLGLIIFAPQGCFQKKSTSSIDEIDTNIPDSSEEDEDLDFATETLDDGEIGGADYSYLEALDYFENDNFEKAAKMLSDVSEYLQGDGEDLADKDVIHLLSTVRRIEELVGDIEEAEEGKQHLLREDFSKIGMNMVKDYVAIAVAMDESPDDNEFYVSKAIMILNRLVSDLSGQQKAAAERLLQDLDDYDQMVLEGKDDIKKNLKNLNQRIYQLLVEQKIYFS